MSTQPGQVARVLPFPLTKEQLLPVKQAAGRLGISLRTLEDWIYDGKIEFVKLGRCVRIKETTIDAIIKSNTRPAKLRLS